MKYFSGAAHFFSASLLLLTLGCSKSVSLQDSHTTASELQPLASSTKKGGGSTPATQYTSYLIKKGAHYCDPNPLKSVRLSAMKFVARFDSSAIYQTIDPVNQYDINKLYGFSEGLNHQYNSARIGWAWVNEALWLYAYVYNKGERWSKEICTVNMNADINCSITLSGSNYTFNVNSSSVTLPRGTTTSTASGYQLYPYFGGDEVAPHDILIKIKNL